jgi:hypothetical protein
MITPGYVARHGRLGVTASRTLVMGVQGYLNPGGTGPQPEEPEEKPKRYIAIPTRGRSRFPKEDDVLRDDDEIMLFINTYIKTQV